MYVENFNKLPYLIDDIRFLQVSRSGFTKEFPEGRPLNTLILTISGPMGYEFSDGSLTVAPGNVIFIPKGTVHSTIYPPSGGTVETVQFDVLRGNLPDCLQKPVILKEAGMEKTFARLKESLPGDPIGMLCLVYGLLRSVEQENRTIPAPYHRLLPALEDLHRNYIRNEAVDEYARMCLMSPSLFRRLFREYTGTSPIEYRNGLRLARAKELMESGEFSIAEAAQTVGFCNLSFFYRLYKRRFGISPGHT